MAKKVNEIPVKIGISTRLFEVKQKAVVDYQEGMTVAKTLEAAGMGELLADDVPNIFKDGDFRPIGRNYKVPDNSIIVIDLQIWSLLASNDYPTNLPLLQKLISES